MRSIQDTIQYPRYIFYHLDFSYLYFIRCYSVTPVLLQCRSGVALCCSKSIWSDVFITTFITTLERRWSDTERHMRRSSVALVSLQCRSNVAPCCSGVEMVYIYVLICIPHQSSTLLPYWGSCNLVLRVIKSFIQIIKIK